MMGCFLQGRRMMLRRRRLSLMGCMIILKLLISVILQVNLYLVDLSGIIQLDPAAIRLYG